MPRSASEAGGTAWLLPCAVAAAFVGLAHWSWGKWTDVHIDFGSELYAAWQISEGKALYRDLAYRNGPLSHHWNALWFAVAGVSIRTLVYCNLAILAGICVMTWRVFARACGPPTAAACCLVLLAVFGFSQYTGIANYNYVTPYQHSQTHGVALSLALILALCRGLGRPSAAWSALAGGLLGGVLLTKAELGAPALALAALGWLLLPPADARGQLAPAFALGVLALPLLGFAWLASRMDAGLALEGMAGNWRYLGGDLLRDRFYAAGAGLDDVGGNAAALLRVTGGLAAAAAAALALDRLLPAGRWRRVGAPLLAAALFALLAIRSQVVPWPRIARALPLTSAAAATLLVADCWRARADRPRLLRRAPLALWSVWSLALLAKMLLAARFGQYGFALAMPATLLLVALLLELPRCVFAHSPGRGGLARALAAAALAAGVLFFLRWSDRLYDRRAVPVGSGADRIWVDDPRGRAVARGLDELARRMGPRDTLLVLPEGVALNYWLRRENPSRYSLFLPPELDAHGADAMLADLRAHPPDFVALVHRRSREFGVGPFGVDPRNGRDIVAWVERHYRRVALVGAEPFGDRFGIALLERAP